MTTPPPIGCATWIALPPEEVWPALATAEGWDGWFTSGTRLDPRPGGELRLAWNDFGADRITTKDGGEVLVCDEPARFSFTWNDPPSRVTFTLIPQDGGTRVELVEDRLPDGAAGVERAIHCAAGWGEALTLLKFWLEHQVTFSTAKA